jgi:ATP-dependent protease Clp ATPase subunit
MLDVMYEIPMRKDVTHSVITREMVEHGLHPLKGLKSKKSTKKKAPKKKTTAKK